MALATCSVTGTLWAKRSSHPCMYLRKATMYMRQQPVVSVGTHVVPLRGLASGFWYKSANLASGKISR